MKKKTKNLMVLLILLVVLVAGYFAVDLLPENTAETETFETESIPVADFTEEEIASYCYNNGDYEMGFLVTAEGYVHYREEAFPVNASAVDKQISAIAGLTALQKTDSTDKAEYGLDMPGITVAVTLTDQTERTFFFGDRALFEDAYYLLDVEQNVIYLAESELYKQLQTSWSMMVQPEEKVLVSTEQIMDVAVETAGVQTMVISYDETKEQPWQLTTPEGTCDGDSEAVLAALGAFKSYDFSSTIEYACTDFAKYGLDRPITTVTVRYTEEESGEVNSLVFEFGNIDAETEEAYVRVNGSPYVYSMTEYEAEAVSVFDTELLKYQPEEAVEETE